MKVDKNRALELLKSKGNEFETVFTHGTLSVEVYKPSKVDLQQPHDRDEIYIVISGQGEFKRGGETMTFKAGDFLFVPAHMEHRFVNFSEDFATWVIFYGTEGGEKL